jgi:hypothetical protein
MCCLALQIDNRPVFLTLFKMFDSEANRYVAPQTAGKQQRKKRAISLALELFALRASPERQALLNSQPFPTRLEAEETHRYSVLKSSPTLLIRAPSPILSSTARILIWPSSRQSRHYNDPAHQPRPQIHWRGIFPVCPSPTRVQRNKLWPRLKLDRSLRISRASAFDLCRGRCALGGTPCVSHFAMPTFEPCVHFMAAL